MKIVLPRVDGNKGLNEWVQIMIFKSRSKKGPPRVGGNKGVRKVDGNEDFLELGGISLFL